MTSDPVHSAVEFLINMKFIDNELGIRKHLSGNDPIGLPHIKADKLDFEPF